MDDRENQVAAGKEFAMRYLLSSLYMQYLYDRRGDAGFARAMSERSINAIDQIAAGANGDEAFRHSALHEVETFWQNLLAALPGFDGKGPKPDD